MPNKAPVIGGSGKADLPDELFAEPFHQSLVFEAARADMASRRRGTASTLTRGEVAFTTAKAWRQKGTGRARVGALGVSSRFGGGVTFGPKPRHYTVKVNRKARRRALRSALSVHAERGSVAVLDATTFDTPSTKTAAGALTKWGARNPVLIVLTAEETGAMKSFRNIPRTTVIEVGATGVADVIGAAAIIISETALKSLEERLAGSAANEEATA
jgi:large subunit ribosomal protein L4